MWLKLEHKLLPVSLVMISLKAHDLFTNPPGNRVNRTHLGDVTAHEQTDICLFLILIKKRHGLHFVRD